jgi:hypothetical protein
MSLRIVDKRQKKCHIEARRFYVVKCSDFKFLVFTTTQNAVVVGSEVSGEPYGVGDTWGTLDAFKRWVREPKCQSVLEVDAEIVVEIK